MPCLLSLLDQFEKSLVEPKEFNGSQEAVRGSKEILENLRSERYVQGPAVAMVHTKVRSIFRLPNVFLRVVE